MEKKKKLLDILEKVSNLNIDIETAEKQILRLFNVSGNEANQSANKKDGEVALLEKYSKFLEDTGYLDTDWWQEKPTSIEKFFKQ